MAEVTRLLHRVREGDRTALEELMPLVYTELRRIAGSFMRRQPPEHTLQPTALVNEAFLKLFQDSEPQIAHRVHFLALMSRVMRQVLVDYARAHVAAKRGGGEKRVPWETSIEVAGENATEHQAPGPTPRSRSTGTRRALACRGQRDALLGGMTAEEVALALDRSAHVVRHQLRVGRAWLRRALAR